MSVSKKISARQELESIEDAYVASILEMAASELRHELSTNCIDPDALIEEVDDVIQRAKASAANEALRRARTELANWRASNGQATSVSDLSNVRARLDRIQNDNPSMAGLMLAARKGNGLSEKDKDGLLGDIADLERLDKDIEA